MKKTKKTILTTLLFLAGIFTCYAKDSAVDLSKIKAWDESVTKVNQNTYAITFMKAKSGVSIDFEQAPFDASDFNSLEITNKATSLPYTLSIEYTNGTKANAYVEDFCTSFSMPLDEKAKKGIAKIDIQACQIAGSLKIFSLTFKSEKAKSFIYSPDEPVVDSGNKVPFNTDVSALDFVGGIKVGINLGNTFDAIVNWGTPVGLKSETSWGNPKTTKEIIHMYKEAGYTAIRIPVTWANHIIDDKYTIDPLWMARVKTIVNWAIDEGLYVMLNEHHSVRDNMAVPLRYAEGYRVSTGDEAESENFLRNVWKQIAVAFNNSYDEHLIFETMNEPRNTAHAHTWNANMSAKGCKECHDDFILCNKFNQIILDEIRASGGNNANRFVMIPSLGTDSGAVMNKLFEMPKDSANDKLIITIHNYIMGSSPKYTEPLFTRSHEIRLDDLFIKMNDNFVSKGIPVILGETGAVKTINEEQRIKWVTYCVSHAKQYGILTVLWEDGGDFQCFDRRTTTCFDKNFVDAMIKAAE